MDALERISRHDLGLDLALLIQSEKIGDRCLHDVRLHLEMDVEWRTDYGNVFEKNVMPLDLGNASGGKPDDHDAPRIGQSPERRVEDVATDRIEHRVDPAALRQS